MSSVRTFKDFIEAASAPDFRSGDELIMREYITQLKQNVGDVNAVDEHGNTALMLAASSGRALIVDQLLGVRGIDTDMVNKEGFTAFTSAHFFGHTAIAAKFPNPADLGRNPSTVAVPSISPDKLLKAIRRGDEAKVKQYIDANAQVTDPRTFYIYGLAYERVIEELSECYVRAGAFASIYDTHWRAIISFLHGPVATKWLFTMTNSDNSNLLKSGLYKIKDYKQNLFDALMTMSEENQFAACKQIIDEKEKTVLGKVFMFGKTNFNKGVWLKIQTKYLELSSKALKEKLKVFNSLNDISEAQVDEIINLLEKGAKLLASDNGEVFVGLLKWLQQVSKDKITETIAEHLKLFKTELLAVINILEDASALKVLEQVFDESKSDKKNDATALANVFWAGHPDIKSKRLGAAYDKYKALKQPSLVMPQMLFGQADKGGAKSVEMKEASSFGLK